MNSLRVLSIFGTRPEAVKMAPVIKRLSNTPGIISKVCVTAQHREMLDQVMDLFMIKPDYDLNLMQPGQELNSLTADILIRLKPVLESFKPDWILVQGDTTTVMAAALLAYYHRIKVGHVEAGLRTHDKWQPFPEEINRRIAGVVADLHFAPTEHSRKNLLQEGIPDWRITVTGNTVVDALQIMVNTSEPEEIRELLSELSIVPEGNKLVLITAHRRENFGEPIEQICGALRRLAEMYKNQIQFVYPVHLNPNIHEPVHRILSGVENIKLIQPMDYLNLIHLMKHARLILTDSGGIQEEATALKIPTLVLREVTERPEGIEAGILKLVGTAPEKIVKETRNILDHPEVREKMTDIQNPFGKGDAAERIVNSLRNFVSKNDENFRYFPG